MDMMSVFIFFLCLDLPAKHEDLNLRKTYTGKKMQPEKFHLENTDVVEVPPPGPPVPTCEK